MGLILLQLRVDLILNASRNMVRTMLLRKGRGVRIRITALDRTSSFLPSHRHSAAY